MTAEVQSIKELASEYDWLRQQGSQCLASKDENGFEQAYEAAETVRERLFTTAVSTPTAALQMLRFIVAIGQERKGDLSDTGAIDGLLTVLVCLESSL